MRRRSSWIVSIGIILACVCVTAAHGAGYLKPSGDQFALDGTVYKIKGANYYPASAPWGAWFGNWNWAEITADVDRMHSIGINAMRINLPYSSGGWGGANVNQTYLDRLERLVEYLRYKGMKANITLFDWETSFPPADPTPGSAESQHKAYVTAIVTRLKDNKGVFLWDVKNEPDHPSNIDSHDDWNLDPSTWPKRDQIVGWLSRMCQTVRNVDTNHNHSVGCGIRWWENTQNVLPFEDVAIFHSYWSNIGSEQIPDVRGFMGANQKPILVQEFGWPSQPHPGWRKNERVWDYNFTEANQLSFYQTHLGAFNQHSIAGCIMWQALDLQPYVADPNTDDSVTFENYFGLWRMGGVLKPAGAYYRDNWQGAFFPYSDSTIPAPATGVSAVGQDRGASLAWTHSASADCAGVVVRCSTTGYPASPTDGQFVCDVSGEGKTTGGFSQSGLAYNTTYYYSFFAYDYARNYGSRATATAATLFQPVNLLSGASIDSFTGGVANGWTAYERYTSGSSGPIYFASDGSVSKSGGVSQAILGYGTSVLPSASGQYAHAGMTQSVPAVPGKTYMLVGYENMTAPTSGSYYFRTFGANPSGSTDPGPPGAANVANAYWMGPDRLFWNSDPCGSNGLGGMYKLIASTTAAADSVSCWAGVGISLVAGRGSSDKTNYDSFYLHEIDNPVNASLVNGNMEGPALDCNDADVHIPSGWVPVGGGYGRYVGYNINSYVPNAHGGVKSATFLCYPGTCEEGLMQRVLTCPGEALAASVWVKSVATGVPTTTAMIGIDPTGGTDMFAPSVVWSSLTIGSSTTWSQISVSTTAQSTSAALFIRDSSGSVTNGYHTIYADDAVFTAKLTALRPAPAKALPDGRVMSLNGCRVTAAFNGFFYVEDAQRTSGIKVIFTTAVSIGQKVDVTGTMGSLNGERQITASSVVLQPG